MKLELFEVSIAFTILCAVRIGIAAGVDDEGTKSRFSRVIRLLVTCCLFFPYFWNARATFESGDFLCALPSQESLRLINAGGSSLNKGMMMVN